LKLQFIREHSISVAVVSVTPLGMVVKD